MIYDNLSAIIYSIMSFIEEIKQALQFFLRK